MKNKSLSFLTIVVCVCIMLAATTVAMAVPDSSDVSSVASSENSSVDSSSEVSSDASGEISSDNVSDAQGSDSSDTSDTSDVLDSSDSSDSSEDGSSDTSSEGDSSEDSSSDNPSSGTTTSRPHITSQGAGGTTNSFIQEDPSDLSQNNSMTSSTSSDTTEGDDEGYYVENTEVTNFAKKIYKVIWIPIVIAVLCVVGLLYVNVMYKKGIGFAKTTTPTSSRGPVRKKRSSREINTARRKR